jgi:hypothetical protein
MRETEDELIRNMLASTAAVINATGGVNGDNPTELSRGDIDTVVLSLLGNDAIMISDNIEGSLKFGKVCAEVKPWVIDLECLAA